MTCDSSFKWRRKVEAFLSDLCNAFMNLCISHLTYFLFNSITK